MQRFAEQRSTEKPREVSEGAGLEIHLDDSTVGKVIETHFVPLFRHTPTKASSTRRRDGGVQQLLSKGPLPLEILRVAGVTSALCQARGPCTYRARASVANPQV